MDNKDYLLIKKHEIEKVKYYYDYLVLIGKNNALIDSIESGVSN